MAAELLIAGLIAVVLGFLLAGPLHASRQRSRREEAWRLRGTAQLHAIGAEHQRVEAVRAQHHAASSQEAARAAQVRQHAELELEKAVKESERARALDPDVSAAPDGLDELDGGERG